MGTNYNPKTITDGLVLAFDAANVKSYPRSGTDWRNILSSTVATMVGTPTFTNQFAGYFAMNAVFGGTNSFTLPNDLTTATADFTVIHLGRYRTYTGTSRPRVFTVKLSTTTIEVGYLDTGSGGSQYIRVNNPVGNSTFISKGDVAITDNVWQMHSVVVQGVTATFYLNDALLVTSASGVPNLTGSTSSIGGSSAATSATVGDIAFVLYYNKALSAAEIRQNFNAFRGRFGL